MASPETLARILDSIGDGVVTLDREWRVVHLNRAAAAILRRDREALIDRDFWLEFPGLLGSTLDTELHHAVAEQKTVTFEATSPGLGITLEVRAHPSPDGLSFSFRDVTERRREEAQLAAALAREQAGRAEQRRANFLARLGVLLGSSLDQAATLQRLAGLIVPALADICVIDVVEDDGSVARVAGVHGDEGHRKLVEELRRFPPGASPRNPVERALATGQPQAAAHVDEATLPDVARDAEHLEVMRSLGIASYMMVPLITRGRTLGVISFLSSTPERR